jgi:hypothetical protein
MDLCRPTVSVYDVCAFLSKTQTERERESWMCIGNKAKRIHRDPLLRRIVVSHRERYWFAWSSFWIDNETKRETFAVKRTGRTILTRREIEADAYIIQPPPISVNWSMSSIKTVPTHFSSYLYCGCLFLSHLLFCSFEIKGRKDSGEIDTKRQKIERFQKFQNLFCCFQIECWPGVDNKESLLLS